MKPNNNHKRVLICLFDEDIDRLDRLEKELYLSKGRKGYKRSEIIRKALEYYEKNVILK